MEKYEGYSKLLIIIFSMLPIIDSLNGFVLLNKINIGFSLGQVFRSIMIVCLIILLLKEGYLREHKNNKFLISGFVVFISIFTFQFLKSRTGVVFNLKATIKLLNIFLIIETFKFLYKKKFINNDIIEKILDNLSIIMSLTIVIPYIFNIGKSVYSTGAGYKGFYYANNELSIVLLILFIYSLYKRINCERKIYTLKLILVTISNLLVGSKTNMLGVILISVIYFIVNFKSVKKHVKIDKSKIIYTVLVLFILILFSRKELIEAITRQIHFFKELDLATYIFSSRNIFLKESFTNSFNSNDWFFNFLFGNGFYKMQHIWRVGKLTELDFFDTFFAYGIIGVSFIYYYLINIFKMSIKEINEENYFYYLAYVFFIAFSFVAGHVLYSGLAGSIFALICAALVLQKGNRNLVCR